MAVQLLWLAFFKLSIAGGYFVKVDDRDVVEPLHARHSFLRTKNEWPFTHDAASGADPAKQPENLDEETATIHKRQKGDTVKQPENLDDIQKDTEKTIAKAEGMSPSEILYQDLKIVERSFFPGPNPDSRLFWGMPALATVVSVVWLLVYWFVFYKHDRDEQRGKWDGMPRIARQEDSRMKDVKPDFVLLFHHPNYEYADKDTQISRSAVRTCIVKRHQGKDARRHGYLKRVEECLEKKKDTGLFHGMSSALGQLGRDVSTKVKGSLEPQDDEESAKIEESEKVTLGHLRTALLQDLYDSLPLSGFQVVSFSSVDDDEIFVGLSIESPEFIREELIRAKVKLQMNPSVAEKLQIGQDPNEMESSPPFVEYDPRLANNVLGEDAIDEKARDLQFYKTFHGKKEGGSIVSGVDRIRLIQRHLNTHINLDLAVQEGILKDWYPAHSSYWLEELDVCWANLANFKDFTFVQPMTFIQQYFGSRVAFTLAWNGMYCKMLLALLPISILFEVVDYLGGQATGNHIKGGVLAFSIVLAIWSKLAYNLWEREQGYFMVLWDLTKVQDFSVRPDFHGKMQEDPVDSTQKSLQYSENLYIARQAVAWLVTIIFCIAVGVCVFCWITLFNGQMDIVASICLAIMIQVFQFIYNAVAEMSTKMENHKYQVDFYGSYLMKLFIFQFVNQFSAFFFIAVKQKHTKWGCPDDDCIGLLRKQLSVTLAVISLLQIVMVFLSTYKVKFFIWLEDRALAQECEKQGKEMPVRGFLEEQAKYEEYRIRAQIEGMVQLVVSLGYVLIFGSVAPRIVPLCFLVFVVQLRATAHMTTSSCRRPLPRRSTGLGAWQRIVKFLMGFGVVFSGFLLVAYGPSFKDTFLMTRVSGLIIYVAGTFAIWTLVSLAVPSVSKQMKVLASRRDYVLRKVGRANEEANIAQLKKRFKKEKPLSGTKPEELGGSVLSEEILSGAWDKIPHLVDAHFAQMGSSRRMTDTETGRESIASL